MVSSKLLKQALVNIKDHKAKNDTIKERLKADISDAKKKEKNSLSKKISKLSKKKVVSRKVVRKGTVTYKIPEYHDEKILNDPNRFFTGELQEVKRSMFFE